jgi:hypothetical protein
VTTSRSRGSAADSSAGGGRAQQLRPHALGEHALLADGQRGAIVGPRGDLVWMCAPFWDSEPVFDSLVGGRGVYAISPHDPAYVWGGSYEPGSLIWSSRWVTDSGITQCREALARPADDDTLTLLRRVEATDGPADLDVLLAPSAGFTDRGPTRLQRFDADGRSGWTARLSDLHLRWTGAADSEPDSSRAWTQHLRVAPGEHHDLILEISPRAFTEPPPEPDSAWSATRAAWAAAAVSMTATIAPRDAAHSHAVLTGLTSPGGGMVAAATTSLPERSEAGRNYDYRYVWIRDQCYAGQAAAVAGSTDLLDAAVSFVGDRLRADGARMVPAYTTRGEAVPGQRPRSSPPGYPGAELITGNWVNRQFQLDAFGEALLLLAAAAAQDRLDLDGWQAVEAAVAAIEHRWTEPDAGIWELDDHRWTHSRLTCVAGLRTVAAHAPAPQAGRWSSLADAILADTARTCLHPDGYWQRAVDDPRVDAALLLPPLRGALAVDDPRTVATRQAVLDQLEDELYVYRFRHDQRPLGDAEGAFTLCGFIAALDAHHAGQAVTAARLFERNRASCGPAGLFTEEFDIGQRQLRGNLPQAFVHALLLETAATLSATP